MKEVDILTSTRIIYMHILLLVPTKKVYDKSCQIYILYNLRNLCLSTAEADFISFVILRNFEYTSLMQSV